VREADNLATFMCRTSWKSGSLNLLEHSGPHRACYGTPLPFIRLQRAYHAFQITLCWFSNSTKTRSNSRSLTATARWHSNSRSLQPRDRKIPPRHPPLGRHTASTRNIHVFSHIPFMVFLFARCNSNKHTIPDFRQPSADGTKHHAVNTHRYQGTGLWDFSPLTVVILCIKIL